MGCDIHIVVQFIGPDGEWVTEPDYRSYTSDPDGGGELPVYDGRNYGLFGMLVDGHSRARLDTPGIALARGLPPDFDHVHDDHHSGDWLGDHTFSWLTLKEILRYDWDKVVEGYDDLRSRRDWAGLYWWMFVGACMSLGPPSEVRIVFGFDS